MLPDEVAIHVLSFLSPDALLICTLVSRRWKSLSEDQLIWKALCSDRGWRWRSPSDTPALQPSAEYPVHESDDDEGMGDEEEDAVQSMLLDDSGYVSTMDIDSLSAPSTLAGPSNPTLQSMSSPSRFAPLPSLRSPLNSSEPNYKLLYQTHRRIRHRIMHGSYRLYNLQTPGGTMNHTNAIYCLQLYTYPDTGVQVLFTGSKDQSVREWNLATGEVTRIIEGIHTSSILSICVHNGLLVTGGSDRRVAICDLRTNAVVKKMDDHMDSVLCVRFDDKKLVTCSKGMFSRVLCRLLVLPSPQTGPFACILYRLSSSSMSSDNTAPP